MMRQLFGPRRSSKVTHLVSHDGAVTVRNRDARDAVVHELDALALMRPKNFAEHRIDDDVDRKFGRVGRKLVVLRHFRRLVQDERVFFEGVVKRLPHAGALQPEAPPVRRGLVVRDGDLERLVQESANQFLLKSKTSYRQHL